MTKKLLFLSIVFTFFYSSFAQNKAAVTLPRAFQGVELGMSMDSVKAALSKNSIFVYQGEPDVSLLPRPDESLIEVAGSQFVDRAFFQFYKDKLFVMIFALKTKDIDHYSVFTSLSAKYGKPEVISPAESVWLDASTRVSIERPLAVKYIDIATFEELKANSQALKAAEDISRANFLGGF